MLIDAAFTLPTGLLGLLTLLSVVALVAGFLRFSKPRGPLMVGCGLIGLVGFGFACGIFLLADQQQRQFNENRALLLFASDWRLVRHCSHDGRLVDDYDLGTAPNCYVQDNYRVWTADRRYYIGVATGDRVQVEAIFDRDGLIDSDPNSIFFMDANIDRDRIGFVFAKLKSD
jgi:hypothetical protein